MAANENDILANKTIEILGLNCKKLVDRRRTIIKSLEGFDSESIKNSFINYIECHQGFYTVLKYLFEKSI